MAHLTPYREARRTLRRASLTLAADGIHLRRAAPPTSIAYLGLAAVADLTRPCLPRCRRTVLRTTMLRTAARTATTPSQE